jgi:UDP-hydrolysing UDP-N-acetyl-D-glucosamine 2-epimerase
MRRVCVVITARPSYSRIKTALSAIDQHPDLSLQLVVAGSALLDRYGTAVDFVEKDGFSVAARVQMVLEGDSPTSMAKTTGLGILELATVFDNLKPDVVISIADRYETMATAVAASYMNIPLAHVQGGEVTGNIDEKVRHAVTKLADLHLVASERAKERVLKMGEDEERVFFTGCPSIDLAMQIVKAPELDFDPVARYGGVGTEPGVGDPYLVVMQHPVTTEFRNAKEHIEITLAAVRELGVFTYWFWPNVDAGADGTSGGIRAFRERNDDLNIRFFKNMAPLDFLKLISNCGCLIGNSSVGIREAGVLGVRVVNIGNRQRGRERGCNVVDVEYSVAAIKDAVRAHLDSPRPEPVYLYGNGGAGREIAEILATAPLRIEKMLAY